MIKTEEAFSLKCCDNADKFKVRKILKDSLDLIHSPSVKIQIMDGKICLRCKGETFLGAVNKLLKTKSNDMSQANFHAYNLNFH